MTFLRYGAFSGSCGLVRMSGLGQALRAARAALLVGWLVTVSVSGNAPAAEGGGRLASALAHARAHERAKHGVVGMSVVDLRTGLPVVSHRADQAMTPASNQKILTSAFALTRLGAGFAFTTRVCARGKSVWW